VFAGGLVEKEQILRDDEGRESVFVQSFVDFGRPVCPVLLLELFVCSKGDHFAALGFALGVGIAFVVLTLDALPGFGSFLPHGIDLSVGLLVLHHVGEQLRDGAAV